ncbi:hypothetical protein KGQ27_01640 [Patescibacteria group bacterium]|nr:hypothetical protein [Patescibacteria group bacterium]MDE2010832.1 hypothetical protein [Patescibacteria group bacterium]
MTTIIFVFGNPDFVPDSLPLKILPRLQISFPAIQFEVKDPNEEWNVPEELMVIDTAVGIDKITVFHSLDDFAPAPRVSMHDFDALANLRFLKKLGKLRKVTIIGVPSNLSEDDAVNEITKKLPGLVPEKTNPRQFISRRPPHSGG